MHKLRIVGTENGNTQGTRIWLDDMELVGVTRVYFGAELNSVCTADISINVCKVEIEASPRMWIQAMDLCARGLWYRLWNRLNHLGRRLYFKKQADHAGEQS